MAEQKAAAVEAAPKSKKKLIIIIAAVALLGGGGAGAYFMMKPKPKADAHAKEEVHEEAKKPAFMTLETFTVNLQPDPEEQYLQADISLQLADAKEEEVLKENMPLVKSRVLMILSSKKSSEITSVDGKNTLMKEIVTELNKPYAPKGKPLTIAGVFFTNFIVQ